MRVHLASNPRHENLRSPAREQGADTSRLYTRRFFQVFAGVVLFMTSTALQFHFGQYIAYLGHGIAALGWISSISIAGTLAIRLRMGRWIDRFGCRPVWIGGTLVVTCALGAIQFVEALWLIVLLRSIVTMASATAMTTVAVFAAQIAPPHRRAESIGTIGLAGFCGMIAGPALGDWIFSDPGSSSAPYHIFFTASAVASLLAGGVVWQMDEDTEVKTHSDTVLRQPGASKKSQLSVIRDHWPGMIVMVGVVFAIIWCLLSLYLERLAEARGFQDIKVFFLFYAPTAMILRVVFRRLPQQIGRTRTLVGGLFLMGTGTLFLVGVATQAQFILPAILMGAGHCFVFPSMIDLCASRLPYEHRGTGTALILAASDVGMLIGFVALGELIDKAGFDLALQLLAGVVFAAALIFAASQRKVVFARRAA